MPNVVSTYAGPSLLQMFTGGEPYQKQAPILGEMSTDERYLSHVFEPQIPPIVGSWTIGDVRTARDQHALGNFMGSGMLTSIVMTDPRVHAAVRRRCGPGLGIPRSVSAPSRWNGAGVSETIRQETAALFADNSPACSPGALAFALRTLVNMGFAIFQNVWALDDHDGRMRPELRAWPATLTQHNQALRRYQVHTTEGLLTIQPNDAKWIVIEPWGFNSYEVGAIRAAGTLWADRSYALRDRSNHSQVHGTLAPIGFMPEGVRLKSQEGAAFKAALQNLQKPNAGGVFAFGSKVETFEPKTLAWQVFQQVIESDSADVELLYTGISSGGVYKSIPQIDGVQYDLVRGDLNAVRAALQVGMIRPFVALNWGETGAEWQPPLDWRVPDPREETRLTAIARKYDGFGKSLSALRSGGLVVDKLTVETVASEFGIDDDAARLDESKAKPAAPGQPGAAGAQPGGAAGAPPPPQTADANEEVDRENDAGG